MKQNYELAKMDVYVFTDTDIIATSTTATMGEWVPRVNEGGASSDIWNNWNDGE